jgi:hypothetical protein
MEKPSLWAIAVAAGALFSGSANFVAAQEKSTPTPARMDVYDARREGTIVGTVLKYGPSSAGSPGPHVTLQTSAGIVDVHLGDARLLAAKHFNVQTGDTLRIVGETVSDWRGTQFLARIVQNGTNAIEVRSARGILLSNAVPPSGAKKQGGAL